MACFSIVWIQQLIIWIIVIAAIVAIIRIVVPWLTGIAGGSLPGPVWAILNIVLWAVVAIAVVIIVFDLIACIASAPRILPR
jgi:hypothetical protein